MLEKITDFFKHQSSVRYIAVGFLLVILIGSGLLMIPACIKAGAKVTYIDALYTSTSAVCVTGLIALDVADNFTILGQVIVMLLIQVGGLGITTLGAAIILAFRGGSNLKQRNIIQESLNMDDARDLLTLFRRVFLYTFFIELIGMFLSVISFVRNYSVGEAFWKSLFHSIAAFNNSGFDILGGGKNLLDYSGDVLLNLVTIVLIILGGIGFLVISDVIHVRGNFKKLQLHSKIVLTMTGILLVAGLFLIKLTEQENISWLGAFFMSTSARTAGFSTFTVGGFSKATLIVLIVLMFIGASPGSTGGGIKTTTFFVLLIAIRNMITHHSPHAFKYSISQDTLKKAMVVTILAIVVILTGTFLISIFDPNVPFLDTLFETTSAYATVGLSTGITSTLSLGSKLVSIVIMYIGRVGPLTVVSLWYSGHDQYFKYSEGAVTVG